MMPEHAKSLVGLALSGGAARGIAHIAVLEVLEQEGIPIRAIAGTSAGSIVGALYAAGMTLPDIKRILIDLKWIDIFQLNIPKKGLISSEGIYHFMKGILPVKKFSALAIPFAAVATDLHTGEKVSITNGSIARAVQASCSLPVIFTPTEISKKILVDGGMSSQIPVRTVREELGANRVIAVDVNSKAIELGKYNNLISIAAHISALWAAKNAREEKKLADVIIEINAKGIPLYDLSKSNELLRRGKRATEEKMPAIRVLLQAR